MRTEFLKTGAVALALAMPLAQAHAERLFGLTADSRIVTFDSTDPLTETSSGAITGVFPGDTLVGLDLRPATRTLYSASTSGRIYTLVASGGTYVATVVGQTAPALAGTDFGIDFNPVPDRLRVVSNTNQNLRINVDGGATLVDGAITLDGSSNVDLIGASYTNSRAGALTTVLYALDSVSDRLVRSTSPNLGTYVSTNLAGATFGALGVGFTNSNFIGFDISGATGAAFFGIDSALYGVDLTTGAANFLGTIGSGTLIGLTAGAVPEPASWALMITGFGLVGSAMRRRAARTVVTAA